MKKALIILVGLLVTITASALIIPGFVDWSQYRDQVANLARDYTGRDLTIEGDISFHVLPNPALSLKGLSMKNSEGGVAKTLITLDSLDVNIAFFPLLSREIQVESLTLEGANISLEVDAEGRKNWIFSEEKEGNNSSKDDGFSLDNFNIINSTISYRDAQSGIFEEFSNITANIKAESKTGPFEVKGDLVSREEPVGFNIISGKIVQARSFPLTVNLVLPGAEDGVSFVGTVVMDGPASALSGDVFAKGLNAQAMVYSFQNLFQKSGNHPVNSARPFEFKTKLVATKARIGLKPIFLKIGESVAEGEMLYLPEESIPNLNATVKINTLKLDHWLAGIEKNTDLSTSNQGLPNFESIIDISIGAIEYNGGIISRAGVKGQFQNNEFVIERVQALLPGGSDVGVMGKVDFNDNQGSKFDGAIRISANNLRGLLNWAGVDLKNVPQGQLASFAMESGLKIEGNSYNFIRARGQLDITRFNGDARIRLGGRPNYAINVGLSRFDLDSYFPLNSEPEGQAKWEDIQLKFDEALSPLKDFDGSFKIKSQQATIKKAVLENFEIDAVLNKGKLTLKTFKSSDTLGIKTDISGTVEVGANAPLLDLVVDLEAGSLAKILKWSQIDIKADPFELGVISARGRVSTDLRRVTLNLEGQGVFGTYKTSGTIEGLSENPESFDVVISLSHPDHEDLLKRLKFEIPFGGTAAPLSINATAKGSFQRMDGIIDAEVMGGIAHIEGYSEDVLNKPIANVGVSFSHVSLIDVADIFNVELTPSADSIGGFKFDGLFNGSETDYTLSDLNTQFGPSTITGEFKINKEGLRPSVRGTLRFDKLPIDAFVEDSRTGAVEAHTIGGERWSRDLIETSFIKNWDANINLTSGEISFGRYRFERPRAEIKSENGVLNISGLRGQTFGGSVDANITIDATLTPKLLMDFTLSDARMESAVVAIADVRPLTGLLNMSGHFEAQGNSQFDMIASLGGQGELSVQDGVIRGINLKRLSDGIGDFSKLSDLVRVLGNSFGGGETPYSVMTTKTNAQSGLVETDGFNIAIEGADIDGGASFNLPRWSMDGGGTLRLVNDETAPPVGVKLVGAIDRPDISYQTDQLKAHVGERIAAKALEATLGLTLPGLLGTEPAVEVAPIDSPEEGGVLPPKPEVKGETIIKGLYDLINSRKKTPKEEDGEEVVQCEGPDCPPLLN